LSFGYVKFISQSSLFCAVIDAKGITTPKKGFGFGYLSILPPSLAHSLHFSLSCFKEE
jgi:hypothetical protein